jgi:hypothetical protein
MAKEVLPLIEEADYPAFRAVIADLPRTYGEWRRLHEAAQCWRRVLDGAYPADLSVSIAEFMKFRQERSERPASRNMLWLCAIEKAVATSAKLAHPEA